MSDTFLHIRDLSFSYKKEEPLFHKLSLNVKRGSRTALLGRNGSGKTTLLLLISGNLKTTEGGILLDGEPLRYGRSTLHSWRRRTGIVFQNPDDQLFSSSLYEDISFGPCNLGLPDHEIHARVREAMELMELDTLARRPVHLLSHGEKKRAAIAGVLAMKPELLLFDEPTAGLDPEAVPQFGRIIETLSSLGTTLLFSTHDMDFACAHADEAAVLKGNGSVEQHPSPEVFENEELLKEAKLSFPGVILFERLCREKGWIRETGERPSRNLEELKKRLR